MENWIQKSKRKLENWKPIHLCWLFEKYGWKIPKYLIGNPAEIIDSYSETNQDSGAELHNAEWYPYGGQTFTNIDASVLGSAKFFLKKYGSPTGNITVEIYAHTGTYGTNGVPTGSPLATSDAIDISTLTTDYQLIQFIFSGVEQINLSASTYYVAVLHYVGDASNYLIAGVDISSPSHSGNSVNSTDGSSWGSDNNTDCCFYVYKYFSSSSSSCSSSCSSGPSVSSSESSSSFSSSSSSFSSSSSCSSSWSSESVSSSSSSFSSCSSSFSSSSFSSCSSSFSSSCSSSCSSCYSSSSSESAVITESQIIIKLYNKDDEYLRNLKEAVNTFSIDKNLYSGSGPLTLILKSKIDDLNTDIILNGKVRIYYRNLWRTDPKLVYYGYIISIDPVIQAGNEQTAITCMGAIAKLQNDFVQHVTQLYEGQLSYLAFEVENQDIDTHIKQILDNYRDSIIATHGDDDPCMIDDVDNYWPAEGDSNTYIDDTSSYGKLSYRYFTTKHLGAIKEVARFLPKNQDAAEFFYWYLDDGGETYDKARFHLKKLSATADHTLQINKHLVSLAMRKNIEGIVNTVYFWNEQGRAGEKVLMTASDSTSQEAYDKIADRITDTEISTRTQGDLLSQAKLKEAKDEKAEMTIVVSDANYDILKFNLGDVINIRDTKKTDLYPNDVLVVQKIVLEPRQVTLELAKPRPDLSTQVETDREYIDKQLTWFGNISTRIDATRLNPGSLHWITEDITFGADSYRKINWLSGDDTTVGTFNLPNGVDRVIAGGDTGDMAVETWLYLDEKNCWCGKDITPELTPKESGSGKITAGENSLRIDPDGATHWTKDQWKGYVLWVNPTGASTGEEKHIIAQNYEFEIIVEGDRPFRTSADDDYNSCPYEVHPFVLRKTTKMSTSGTADSGSATTLIDNALDQAADFWNGYELKITSGDNMGLTRVVNNFVATADRLEFDDLPYEIANGDHYTLYLNPESQIVIVTGAVNADTVADAGISSKVGAVSNPGSGATIEDVTGAKRAYNALDASYDLITDIVNARLNSFSQKILSDFDFGTVDYAGALKAGNITWNVSTGAIIGGSGTVVYRKGIVGAHNGAITFSIDSTTGNANYYGTVTASQIIAGILTGFTIQTGSSGKRIKMSSSPQNRIEFLDDNDVRGYLEIDDDGDGGFYTRIGGPGGMLTLGSTLGASEVIYVDMPFFQGAGKASTGQVVMSGSSGNPTKVGLTWAGGATATFSFNLGDNLVKMSSNIIPSGDLYLGDSSDKWKGLFLNQLLLYDVLYLDSSATIQGNMIPKADSSYDIGTTTIRYTNIYADNLHYTGGSLPDDKDDIAMLKRILPSNYNKKSHNIGEQIALLIGSVKQLVERIEILENLSKVE